MLCNCHDTIFLEYKDTARYLLKKYNSLEYNQKKEKNEVLKKLFSSMGNNVSVNMNCTFVDCNKITIGRYYSNNLYLYFLSGKLGLSLCTLLIF